MATPGYANCDYLAMYIVLYHLVQFASRFSLAVLLFHSATSLHRLLILDPSLQAGSWPPMWRVRLFVLYTIVGYARALGIRVFSGCKHRRR